MSVYDLKLFAPFTKVEELPDYAKVIKGLIDWKQSKDSEDIERSFDQKVKGLKLDGKWDWSDLIKLRRYKDDWQYKKLLKDLNLPPDPLFGERYARVSADKLLRRGESMLGPLGFELWLDRLMLSFASVAYSYRWPEVKALGKSKKDDLYIFHYFPVNHYKCGGMGISSAGFKLGRSTDPQKRLKSVKTGAACLVVPLVVIKGAGCLEPLIHAGMKSVGLRDNDEFYRPQDLMLILALIGVAIEISKTRPASYVIDCKNIKYLPLPKDHEAFDANEDYYDSYCLQGSLVYNEREYGYRQVGILDEDNPFNILYPHSGNPSNLDSSWADMDLVRYREEFKFFATMPLISLNLNLCAIKEAKKEIRRKYGSLLCEFHYEHFTLSHMDIFRSIPDCLLNSELEGADMNAVFKMFYSEYSKG